MALWIVFLAAAPPRGGTRHPESIDLNGRATMTKYWCVNFGDAWWLCLLALIPLLIDWSAQYWLLFPSTNTRRFITGLLAGYGEVAFAVLVLRYFLNF